MGAAAASGPGVLGRTASAGRKGAAVFCLSIPDLPPATSPFDMGVATVVLFLRLSTSFPFKAFAVDMAGIRRGATRSGESSSLEMIIVLARLRTRRKAMLLGQGRDGRLLSSSSDDFERSIMSNGSGGFEDDAAEDIVLDYPSVVGASRCSYGRLTRCRMVRCWRNLAKSELSDQTLKLTLTLTFQRCCSLARGGGESRLIQERHIRKEPQQSK